MNSRRLDALAARLTPKQAVLRVLDEAHKLDSFDAWWQQYFAQDAHPLPPLTHQVAAAVRATMSTALRGKERTEAIDREVTRAIREVAFLFHLHLEVNTAVSGATQRRALQYVWLEEQLRGLLSLEAIHRDMVRLRMALSWDVPYPVDRELTATVEAMERYRVEPWQGLDGLLGPLEDEIETWVTVWYEDQGKTRLSEDAYQLLWNERDEPERIGGHPDGPTLDEVRAAFADEDAFEDWRARRDFSYSFADVRDQEIQQRIEDVRDAMRDLGASGAVATSSVVTLPTVPRSFFRDDVPLIAHEWVDRHVIELAEWGAHMERQGLTIHSDHDEHWLAQDRIEHDGKAADVDLVASLRAQARGHVATFPGRTRMIDGRSYLHLDDYRAWPERTAPGDLETVEGVVVASWNAWVEANRPPDGTSPELAGIPVSSLDAIHRLGAIFTVLDDPQELAHRLRQRQSLVDTVARWLDRRPEGRRSRPWGMGAYEERVATIKTHTSAVLAGLYADQAAITTIRTHYFDGHPVLFRKEEQDLATDIGDLEDVVDVINRTTSRMYGEDRPIDLAGVRRAARATVPTLLRHLVDGAKVSAHEFVGEGEAARALLRPLVLDEERVRVEGSDW